MYNIALMMDMDVYMYMHLSSTKAANQLHINCCIA